MSRTRRTIPPKAWGRITVEPAGARSRTTTEHGGAPIATLFRYTWLPAKELAADLPASFQVAMDCHAGGDGLRRFAPARGLESFVLATSLGGLAILARTRGLDAEARFGYHAMRLIFQHTRRNREHLGRTFKRKSDLVVPEVGRVSGERNDVLPERIGLDRDGHDERWSVAELLRRGREHVEQTGKSGRNEAQCIAAGLLVAARRDPLTHTSLSVPEALGTVRMALFDVGPAINIKETDKQIVVERLLAAIKRHVDDDTDTFNRWFFEGRDNLVHQIAKQTKHGGSVSREIVRHVLLDLVFDAYSYIGDCICLLMQALLAALPVPLNAQERAWFQALYFKQSFWGGLPLILLRDRFDFLKEGILDVMNAPGEPGPIAVLLRLLQYYEEMATKRREADRRYKQRAHHRDSTGRVARTSGLSVDPQGISAAAPDDCFQRIAARLREERGISCLCEGDGTWNARLDYRESDRDPLVINLECEACEQFRQIVVACREFERIGREVIGHEPSPG